MTKIDTNPTVLPFPVLSQPDSEPVRRLIVLVPCLEADLALMTSRIWEMANATGAHVQFVSLYSDPAQEPGLRRALVTMTAVLNSGPVVSAEAEIMMGKDWVEAIQSRWQAGDLVVCDAEQRVGLSRRPLSQILQSGLDIPLYILTGLYPQKDWRQGWLSQTLAWTGSIATMLGFFVLQARLGEFAKGWTTALQLLSIFVEAWLIWAWNRLLG